jgi:hypothetical protein
LSLLKTESKLTFYCRRGLFWSFGLLPLFDGWNVDSFLPCFRQIDDYPYAILGANGWFRCDGLHRPGFPTLLRDVLHALATRVFPRTVAVHTVSSGWGAARSMWMFRLTPPTRPWRGLPRLGVTTSMTLWRGLPTRPSRSSVSATC